jgi:hypothetical protein
VRDHNEKCIDLKKVGDSKGIVTENNSKKTIKLSIK